MLDRDTVPRVHIMPVDFKTYLLSSSPPASNLDLLNYAFSPEAQCHWQLDMGNEPNNSDEEDEIQNDQNYDNCNDILEYSYNNNKILRNDEQIKPIIIQKDENTNSCGNSECSSASSSGAVTPTSPFSPGRTKRVSFADQIGLALVTIKIMTESSDQPPCFSSDILKGIANDTEVVVTGLLPYKLNFAQPASDYMAFREKIEKSYISLENVIIRDYHVMGTVKVKNICFDKQIFIHCTFDYWKSSQDIECKYVQPFGSNLLNKFDTFSFEFDIDPQMDRNQSIQFAVTYKTPIGQFWDNNGGCNYHIIPTDFNALQSQQPVDPLPTSTQPSLKKVSSWTEYGCWHHVNTTSPYY